MRRVGKPCVEDGGVAIQPRVHEYGEGSWKLFFGRWRSKGRCKGQHKCAVGVELLDGERHVDQSPAALHFNSVQRIQSASIQVKSSWRAAPSSKAAGRYVLNILPACK